MRLLVAAVQCTICCFVVVSSSCEGGADPLVNMLPTFCVALLQRWVGTGPGTT